MHKTTWFVVDLYRNTVVALVVELLFFHDNLATIFQVFTM
jgi:hypothetical protein